MKAGAVLAACSLGALLLSIAAPVQAQEEPTIKIGMPNPYSPPGNVIYGEESKLGAEIALALWENRHGLIDGRKVEIIHEDTRGDPEAGRAGTTKLILSDNVDIVVGCNHSSVGLVIARLANEHQTPFVNMNCWSDEIRKSCYEEVFSPANYSSRTANAITEFVRSKPDIKNFVMFAENTDFGLGQATLIEDLLNKTLPDVKVKTETVDRTSRDFRNQIIALKGNPPDLIGLVLVPPAGFLFTQQLSQQQLAPTDATKVIDIGGYVDQPGFWDAVGEAGVGHLAYVLDHKDNPTTEIGEQVQKIYEETTGRKPTRLVLQGFDATWTALAALDKSKAESREATIAALKDLKVEASRAEIYFANEPLCQQWPDIPFAIVELESLNQMPSDGLRLYPAE